MTFWPFGHDGVTGEQSLLGKLCLCGVVRNLVHSASQDYVRTEGTFGVKVVLVTVGTLNISTSNRRKELLLSFTT